MSNLKKECKNMTNANKFISNILKSCNNDQNIENIIILELIKYHPTKQIKIDDIEWLKMKKRPPFNTEALFYKYKNNEKVDDISWKLCIKNLYGNYNRDKEYENDVNSGFRNESHIGTKKQFFIDNTKLIEGKFMGVCNNCKIVTSDITTDHYPLPYKEILNIFINENNIKLIDIDIFENENFEIRMKNYELANKWRIYHDNLANYRLLCKSCNSHFGCYNY